LKAMNDYQKNLAAGKNVGVSKPDVENQSPSKQRMYNNNINYQENISANSNDNTNTKADNDNDDVAEKDIILSEFNAAEYLYISFQIAHHYKSSLRAAKVILRYSTPW